MFKYISSFFPDIWSSYSLYSPPEDNLCEQCGRRPKAFNPQTRTYHPYCDKTCARRAATFASSAHKIVISPGSPSGEARVPDQPSDLCETCGRRPKYKDAHGFTYPYCGRTCGRVDRRRRRASLPATATANHHTASTSTSNLYCGRRCASQRNTQRQNPQHATPVQQPRPGDGGASNVQSSGTQAPVLFYHRNDPHFGFTNFSDHPIEYHGVIYPTSEHLFQAFKFINSRSDIAERIRKCQTSRQAFDLAHRYQSDVRTDWRRVNIAKMDKVLRLKFEQHPDLRQELLDTGNAPLVEASAADAFWGFGADGQGRNELGKALMRLRDSFRGR
ncbi:hypothetical protein EVG20_g1286 [Dentipellis fragilis]|uniref:NADAR domain-containing protein n=1 Tax=Dentipellis fragilis TaxID=205917 RepID=A0A4Y9ZE85_9AGAM|nr:hypothetical protein EVG20_g1286 [Dentipellis fragilis]